MFALNGLRFISYWKKNLFPPPSKHKASLSLEVDWSCDPVHHIHWRVNALLRIRLCNILLNGHIWETTSWKCQSYLVLFERFFHIYVLCGIETLSMRCIFALWAMKIVATCASIRTFRQPLCLKMQHLSFSVPSFFDSSPVQNTLCWKRLLCFTRSNFILFQLNIKILLSPQDPGQQFVWTDYYSTLI